MTLLVDWVHFSPTFARLAAKVDQGTGTNRKAHAVVPFTLEDAFIAAYLIGVRTFPSTALKVIAAQIMGVEAEHRVLGRVLVNDLGLTSVTGLAGSESVFPPNSTAHNLAYERTFSTALPDIGHVVTALGPYLSTGTAGFSATPFTLSAAVAGGESAGQPLVTLQGTTVNG